MEGDIGSPGRKKMNAVENFNSIAAELIASAPTEKARAFAEKVAAQVAAKGDEWIVANVFKLACEMSADMTRHTAPVADNRLFFMQKWQLALAA